MSGPTVISAPCSIKHGISKMGATKTLVGVLYSLIFMGIITECFISHVIMEVEGMIVAYVLLTHDGRCKVTDFGLSRCEELKTFTTTATMRDSVAGTPAFMAPELFEDNTFTEKSDVYSYAVVLWEIFDRGIPWAGLKPQQILYKLIKEQRLDVPKSMPRDLSSLMERAWAQDPDARPSFADICKELQATTPRRPSSISRPWSASSPTAGDAPPPASVASGQGSSRSLASSVMNMFRAAQSDEAASKSPADAQSAEEDASSASPAVKGGVEAAAKSPVDAQSAETDASRASPAIKGGAKAAKNADSTSRINTVFEPMRTWYGAPARAALKKKHGAYPATPEALANWKSFGPVTTAFLDDQGVDDRPGTVGAVAPPGTADTLSTWSAPKNQDHAALIAGVQWKNVYAATGVGPQSPSLRGPAWPWGLRRGTSKRAKGHERDLVIQLRDYEANGGDLDAIRQHIDDAASARVWDMFLANYKCFSRTGDELQMLLPDRVRTTRHLRED